jgi:glyoxylase-like metal-dependent hydrolase (beta-lactamase superfamily II)
MFLMTPAETGQIPNTNIYTVKNIGSNVYFIKTNDGYIVIDAGLSMTNIENSLKEADIDPNKVKSIFLTHSDGDHTAALPLFPNATIYISKDELSLINGTMKRSFLGGNDMPSGVNIENIILLSNGQELLLDETKIECISAPGHTIGSMLYLVDDLYLFTGDAVKIKNGTINVHPYSMDTNLSKKTIEQLNEKINGCRIILTSHYGLHYNN